jgi:hypothetical protein
MDFNIGDHVVVADRALCDTFTETFVIAESKTNMYGRIMFRCTAVGERYSHGVIFYPDELSHVRP